MTFKDVTTATFMAEVVDASFDQPVIVEFWAPWCGPCKQLKPILERVIGEAGGAVRMVKLNIDEHPEIAQQMRIQSIPAVYAFKDGRPVDGFVGALPESQVKQFVQRLGGGKDGPSPIVEAMTMANECLRSGDHQSARKLYAQIVQHDPGDIEAIAGLIHAMIAGGDLANARQMIDCVPQESRGHPDYIAARKSYSAARWPEPHPDGVTTGGAIDTAERGASAVAFSEEMPSSSARHVSDTAALDRLAALIGLPGVKREIASIANLLRIPTLWRKMSRPNFAARATGGRLSGSVAGSVSHRRHDLLGFRARQSGIIVSSPI